MKAERKRCPRDPQRAPTPAEWYLAADLSRDAGEFWVGGEHRQVFHGFNERRRGDAAAVPVFLREISIQSLVKERGGTWNRTKTPPVKNSFNKKKKKRESGHKPGYSRSGVGKRFDWRATNGF